MKQYYMIAGLKVEMDSFGKTVTQAEPYRCEPFDRADIVINVSWERVKEKAPHMTKEVCEYMATGGFFYLNLLNFDGMMIHASAVMMDGGAYLFTAPCGTGKSTHSRLWREVFGDRAVMINDDKPFLRISDAGVIAYGSPWCGKHGLGNPVAFPLKGICILSRGSENTIQRSNPDRLRAELFHQCFVPEDRSGAEAAGKLLERLMELVPLWEMECNKSAEAARVSFGAMGEFSE